MARVSTPTLAVLLLTLLFLVNPIAATRSKTIYVKRNQSIQKAINRADCGDKIIVEKGVYKEQIVITKDDITLIGQPGAVIEPPKKLDKKNPCYGLAGNATTDEGVDTGIVTHAGICIFGKLKLKEFVAEHKRLDGPVKQYVKNPSVSGFTVRNFSGLNIAVVGAQNARVFRNHLVDGLKYGFLTLGSKNTRAEKNIIGSTPGKSTVIALCMDDLSDVQIWNNEISGYFVGLCVQTNYADVRGNHVSSACNSVYVDPGVVGAKLRYNFIGKSAEYCGFFPVPASFGIIIVGAKKTEVKYNLVENINDGGNDTNTAVGIAIYDFTDVKPPVLASGNIVEKNYLNHNELDIQIFSTGKGNVAKNNKCDLGFPASACI